MQETAKSAAGFRVTVVAQLGEGSVYAAAPVRFDGAHALVAQRDSDDAAFPMVVVVAPAQAANQITLINRTRWPVVFTITRGEDQLGALGGIEVGPGGTHQVDAI